MRRPLRRAAKGLANCKPCCLRSIHGKEAVMQVDLPAEGLRVPGFPKIIGPFGFTDLRASLSWSLIDVASLRNYLAAQHNFAAA